MFEQKLVSINFFAKKAEVFSNDAHYGIKESLREDSFVICQKTKGFSILEQCSDIVSKTIKFKAETHKEVPEEDGLIETFKAAVEVGFSIVSESAPELYSLPLCDYLKGFKIDLFKVGSKIEAVATILLASEFIENEKADLATCFKLGIEDAAKTLETDMESDFYLEFLAEFEVL